MNCAWKELLEILPPWLSRELDSFSADNLQELRLRLDAPAELIYCGGVRRLHKRVSREDISFCVNTASRYSPWNAATIRQGYLTASGGHRIGLCGEVVMKEHGIGGIRNVTSLCIRVARDFPGIGTGLASLPGSILILGAPGWGKTTLLRDASRQLARKHTVSVVDERGELFPEGIPRGERMDVLTGAPKAEAVTMVLRTMSPEWIAVDEITAEADCRALLQAQGCGVRLIATAHAGSMEEFRQRPVYRTLLEQNLFGNILTLRSDKSYRLERMDSTCTNGSGRSL